MSEQIQHLEIITDSAGVAEAVLPQTDAGIYAVAKSLTHGQELLTEDPSLLPENLSWRGRRLFKKEALTLSEQCAAEQDEYVRRNSKKPRGTGDGCVLADQAMREYPEEGRAGGFVVNTVVGLHLLPIGAPKALDKQKEWIEHVRGWSYSRSDRILKQEAKHSVYVPVLKTLRDLKAPTAN